MRRRDEQDSTRALAPLTPAADAIRIDSTDLSIERVVELMLAQVKTRSESGVIGIASPAPHSPSIGLLPFGNRCAYFLGWSFPGRPRQTVDNLPPILSLHFPTNLLHVQGYKRIQGIAISGQGGNGVYGQHHNQQ